MVLVGSPMVLINSMMACRVMDQVVEIPGLEDARRRGRDRLAVAVDGPHPEPVTIGVGEAWIVARIHPFVGDAAANGPHKVEIMLDLGPQPHFEHLIDDMRDIVLNERELAVAQARRRIARHHYPPCTGFPQQD